MKKNVLMLIILALALTGVLFVAGKVGTVPENETDENIACTADAMLCPDGTAVGRVGPHCEFAVCPTDENEGILPYTSGVQGVVLLGPQCPVVREDEPCPDKPYQTTVDIFRAGTLFASFATDKNGTFEASLPPGNYVLRPRGGDVFPTCSDLAVTVGPNNVEQVTLSCDTGIR